MIMSAIYEVPDHIVAKNLAGELIILDLEGGLYFGLDEVGARIWEFVMEGNSFSQILDAMLQEFEVPAAQLENDLGALLEQLLQKKLIQKRR